MLHRAVVCGLIVACAATAHALTLEDVRVQATLVQGSSKDPFRVRARLGGADARAVVSGFAAIRFGDLEAQVPSGAFVRRGNAFVWKSYLFGVKKVTVNVKKGTIDVVGGGIELGDLPGPIRLLVGTSKGVACGTFDWNGAGAVRAASGKRGTRKTATGPLEPCFDPPDGEDHVPPSVFILDPTPFPGTATTGASIDLGGTATDDAGLAGLEWSNDQGGGASLVASESWTISGIALVAGDNRITVRATDEAGNVGTDVVDVTYNTNGIAFDIPTALPSALLETESENVKVRQKILPHPDLDPASVELVRIADDGTTTPVSPLADGGNRSLGDDLPGDDVYSTLVGIEGGADATQAERFRVGARTLSAPDVIAWSPVLTIPRVAPVETESIKSAIALADNALELFTSLTGDGLAPHEALDEVELLARGMGALAAGPSTGGLGAWWMTEDGLLGGMLGYDQSARRGGVGSALPPAAPPRVTTSPSTAALPGWSEVGSRRSIILAPYFAEAEPTHVDGMLRGMQCPQFEVDRYLGAEADAERFKSLEEYGLILIASHGDALFDALGDAYRPEWDWKSTGAQAVVLTGTKLGASNLRRWERDLRLGRMAIFPQGVTGVLPSYFSQYSVRLPASIVYVGSCRSSAEPSLASALIERGASAYLGFDGYVDSAFAAGVGNDLFESLLAGQSLADAFTPGQSDGTSAFTFDGDAAMTLATGPIVNRSFEVQSGFLASVAGFAVTGDGRIVGNLGMTLPTDGARMALLSTGLGLTTQSGSFAQAVCLPPLPPGATALKLEYDWNFFSEEFLEYCGSEYQDFFKVTFGEENQLQLTKIDDLCPLPPVPADVGFDKGGVYMTGWRTQSVDVTALAGTTNVLKFAAGDVGDSIFDTVILVDNVRVVAE
jgi:hypothetical protein